MSALLAILLLGGNPEAVEAVVPRLERAVAASDRQGLSECRQRLSSPSQLLSRYTLAYVDWRLAKVDARGARGLLKEAQSGLEKTLSESPADAEALALLGSVLGSRIDRSHWLAVFLGPRSCTCLDRAEALAPDNPRVLLQQGVGAYFTPRSFGGGLERAQTKLQKAADLFAREGSDKPWPNWGRAEVYAWLGQVLAKRGDVAGARVEYERALEVEPGDAWVSGVLLPSLDRR